MDTPYELPDDLNLFSWSMPFVCEKINQIWNHLITMCSPAELRKLPDDDTIEQSLQNESEERQAKLRRKMQLRKKI